jgi:hypothetical protein
MRQMRLWLIALACLVGSSAAGCGGVAVDYAPVAACGHVDLDPSLCPR